MAGRKNLVIQLERWERSEIHDGCNPRARVDNFGSHVTVQRHVQSNIGPACPVRMFIQTFKVEMVFMSAGWSNYTESLLIATLCSQDSGTHHVLDVDHAGRTEISPASYSKAELTSRLRRLPFPTCGRDTSNSKGSTYLQMPQCSSKFQSFTQLSYPTRKTPAEQEDAMLVATVGGTLEYCCGLQTDRQT
ncbi:hypothetical protein ABHI18_007568 [Aspergillus niger]